MSRKTAARTHSARIFAAFAHRCLYCGREVFPKRIPGRVNWRRVGTVDHVVPKSAGGRRGIGNFVLACAECNSRKGARGVEEFALECTGGVPVRMAAILARWRDALLRLSGTREPPGGAA